ncbi:MAG: Ig-like domain-containing protein [Candidatus Eisenbacteria bacterium]
MDSRAPLPIRPRGRAVLAAGLGGLLVWAACGKHDNPTDPGTPPSVTISSPAEGSGVSGMIFTVSGSAADPDTLAAIRLKADGEVFATATASPFSFTFPAFLFPAGEPLTITVEAEDKLGSKGSGVVHVDIEARTPRAVAVTNADQEREPAFSPGGDFLAYTSEGSGGNQDIYTISASGGAATQITTNTNDDISPAWSPLGTSIAFASRRSGNWDIWTIPATGGAATRITESGAHDDRGPAWSPNGSKIAFHSNRDGNWNIYAVAMAGDAAAGVPESLTTAASAESSATWSPAGDAVAFTSNQLSPADLWTATPPSVIISQIEGGNDPTYKEIDPDWSRKGPYVVYSYNRNGNYDIWVLDTTTGRKQILTTHQNADREPVWSPQGDKIAFASNRNGTWDLFILE